jgi:hypothetical protein
MKHIKQFEEFVNEALSSKKPDEIITIDLDMVWGDYPSIMMNAFKKYNIKVKEIKSSPGTFNVTGKKKDILGYLQSEFYEMDADDIKEFYPELLEGSRIINEAARINEGSPIRNLSQEDNDIYLEAKELLKKEFEKFIKDISPKLKKIASTATYKGEVSIMLNLEKQLSGQYLIDGFYDKFMGRN